jgi:hypothetical protein
MPSHVELIASRANVTPFPVVVAQSDYDTIPLGGLYWFHSQLQNRYWAAPTPTPETSGPIGELPAKRAVEMQDAASVSMVEWFASRRDSPMVARHEVPGIMRK